jgi:N-acetyl-1-D-myo-inositol-2-amino-2-deoxy-alpha-D-glucopyranoside deacetylase
MLGMAAQRAIDGPLVSTGEHLVVVVAHPDDETFGCGSLIAAAAAAGGRISVVCATRGELGERRPDPATDAWPLALVRQIELFTAAATLGAEHVELLGYLDSGFDGEPDAAALVSVPIAELANELAHVLDRLQPDVVLTIDGSDGHRDHVHVRDAVGAAVRELPAPVTVVHACLSNSLMRRWATVMAEIDPSVPYLALDLDTLGRPDHELTPIDNSAVLDLRERAIAVHRSQASPYDNLPDDLRRAFLTVDHVVDATPS